MWTETPKQESQNRPMNTAGTGCNMEAAKREGILKSFYATKKNQIDDLEPRVGGREAGHFKDMYHQNDGPG